MKRIEGTGKFKIKRGFSGCRCCVHYRKVEIRRRKHGHVTSHQCYAKNKQEIPCGGLRTPRWCPFDTIPIREEAIERR